MSLQQPIIKHLISAIKLANNRGQQNLVFKIKQSPTEILNVLYKLGLIKSYKEFPGLVIIQLKQYQFNTSRKAFVDLNKFKRIKHKDFISSHDLIKLQRREGGASCYILNTDLGVITSFDAINNNIGGKILFKII